MANFDASRQPPNDGPPMQEPAPPQHEIGVLLVHGIGQQRRGETLVNYGEPMAQWIQQWIDGLSFTFSEAQVNSWLDGLDNSAQTPVPPFNQINDPQLEVLSRLVAYKGFRTLQLRRVLGRVFSRLEAHRSRRTGFPDGRKDLRSLRIPYVGGLGQVSIRYGGECPPNFSLDIEVANIQGEIETSSWLFAEAYWADSFQTPNVVKVSAWSLLVTPWVLANFFGTGISRTYHAFRHGTPSSRWQRLVVLTHWLVRVALIPLLVPFLVAVQVALAALLIFGAIPLDPFKMYTDRILRKFAEIVGDCYVFASSPLRMALIVDRVRSDMEWLSKRCNHLVIVAHSQGAAVTYVALMTAQPNNLRLLVTLGSGLRKLVATLSLGTPGFGEMKLAIVLGNLATLSFVFVSMGYLLPQLSWLPTVSLGGLSGWELSMWIGTTLVFTIFWLGIGVEESDVEFWAWAESLRVRGIRWLDCFASKDPVADGPTFDPTGELGARFNPPENWRKLEVQNTGAVFSDHTGYVTNRDQCLAEVMCEISAYAHSTIPLHSLTPLDQSVLRKESRQRRQRVDQLQTLRMTTILLAAIVVWARWSQLNEFGTWLDTHLHVLPSSSALNTLWDSLENPNQVLGSVGALTLVFMLSLVPYGAWKIWNRYDTWLFFLRMPREYDSRDDFLTTLILHVGAMIYIAVFSNFIVTVAYMAWVWPAHIPVLVVGLLESILIFFLILNLWWPRKPAQLS